MSEVLETVHYDSVACDYLVSAPNGSDTERTLVSTHSIAADHNPANSPSTVLTHTGYLPTTTSIGSIQKTPFRYS